MEKLREEWKLEMPRLPRQHSITGIYHVMIRGINRQIIFEDEEDRVKLIRTLKKYRGICKFELYSYCLMDNHIHLLLKENEGNLSTIIRMVCTSYVLWYNTKYDRIGHLFQGRFRSEAVDERRYFFNVLRYIHQNPLKAGLVDNVFDAQWTSINEYIWGSNLVDFEFGLNLLTLDRKRAIEMYIDYMQQPNDDQFLDEVVTVSLSDSEVRECLLGLGIENISVLQKMVKKDRDDVLGKLKRLNGVTIRQLSRITGIPKSIIHRS